MATPEALIKYYDCLKDSFSKIQDKDNKTALINAALRPKIKDEFKKSQELLQSYLNYIQVFSLIYSDNFSNICNNILLPLFKEYSPTDGLEPGLIDDESRPVNCATRIHESLRAILESSPRLADDLVANVVKVFPGLVRTDGEQQNAFLYFLENALIMSGYLKGDNQVMIISKTFDKLNPPKQPELKEEEVKLKEVSLAKSYELVYGHVNNLNGQDLDEFARSTTLVLIRDFISTPIEAHFKYLLLYLYSLNSDLTDLILDSLWDAFLDTGRSVEERRSSVEVASSFISRAKYITLEQMIKYIEKACKWCHNIIDNQLNKSESRDRFGEDLEAVFHANVQSVLYIITQRYREMYEGETISQLVSFNLTKIVECPLKPLDVCDPEIEQRFKEVSTLYKIANLRRLSSSSSNTPSHKRRKSDRKIIRASWVCLFPEQAIDVPDRVKPIYRAYFHHKFFTINRDR